VKGVIIGPWLYYFLHCHVWLWQWLTPNIVSELYVDSHKGVVLLSAFLTGLWHFSWWMNEPFTLPRPTVKQLPAFCLLYLTTGMLIDYVFTMYEPWNPKKRLEVHKVEQSKPLQSWVAESVPIQKIRDLFKRDVRLSDQMDVNFIKKPPTQRKEIEWLYESSIAARIQGEQIERYYDADNIDYGQWAEPFTYHHLWDTDVDWSLMERDDIDFDNLEEDVDEIDIIETKDSETDLLFDEDEEDMIIDEIDYEDEYVVLPTGIKEIPDVTDEEFYDLMEKVINNPNKYWSNERHD